MTAPAAPAQTGQSAAATDAGTPYIILKKKTTGSVVDCWDRVQSVKARSADQAVREVTAKLDPSDQAGTFVAIPARSWKPVKVTVETKTIVKLGDA